MGLQQYYIAQSLILEIVIMADNADFLANSHSPLIPCLQNPNHVYKRKQKAEKKKKQNCGMELKQHVQRNYRTKCLLLEKRSQINH